MIRYCVLNLDGRLVYIGTDRYAAAKACAPGTVRGSGPTAHAAWVQAERARERMVDAANETVRRED
jgi:hypothetical protein